MYMYESYKDGFKSFYEIEAKDYDSAKKFVLNRYDSYTEDEQSGLILTLFKVDSEMSYRWFLYYRGKYDNNQEWQLMRDLTDCTNNNKLFECYRTFSGAYHENEIRG